MINFLKFQIFPSCLNWDQKIPIPYWRFFFMVKRRLQKMEILLAYLIRMIRKVVYFYSMVKRVLKEALIFVFLTKNTDWYLVVTTKKGDVESYTYKTYGQVESDAKKFARNLPISWKKKASNQVKMCLAFFRRIITSTMWPLLVGTTEIWQTHHFTIHLDHREIF